MTASEAPAPVDPARLDAIARRLDVADAMQLALHALIRAEAEGDLDQITELTAELAQLRATEGL